jgi:hypothetical protein
MATPVQDPKYRSTLRFVAEGVEGLALAAVVFLSWPVTRRWLGNLGAEESDRSRDWPGDGLVSDPDTVFTRAIDIDAPPSSVWPWLVQFGLGRGGFYSYELLERMAGIPVRNVESILPQMQSLEVGDEILIHPNAPGIPVAEVVPGERICFGVSEELEDRFEVPDPRRSWSMYLHPRTASGTRLLLRGCVEPLRRPTWKARLGLALTEPIDCLMEWRMLRTVRRLVEKREGHEKNRPAEA